MEIGLRNDVYRRPLQTALERIGVTAGWRCLDVGAGAGDVAVALSAMVGPTGRVYAVDSDPNARDVVAQAAAARGAQVVALTQSGEDLLLPEPVDLAFARFLLLHVFDPAVVLRRMRQAVATTGWVVLQEPVTTAGRVDGMPISFPGARHPDVGAILPTLARRANLEVVDCWAEAPVGAGQGPVSDYLADLTGVDPGDVPIMLPPLVTMVARRHQIRSL